MPEAARDQYDRAIEIGENRLGVDHHVVGQRRYNRALALSDMGQLNADRGQMNAARQECDRAPRIVTAALGPGHPTTVQIAAALARLDAWQAAHA